MLNGFNMNISLFKVSLLSISLLLAACVTSSPTGRNQVLLFDGSEMSQLGVQSFEEMKSTQTINQNPKINAHVQANHSNERLSTSKLAGYGTQLGQVALQSTEYQEIGMTALGLGVQYGVIMPYGRAQESESDILGLHLMHNAGFDAKQSIELWKNMAIAAGGNEPLEFLSTHPSNENRINNLQNEFIKLTKNNKAKPSCAL